jgi:uncharacterized coiled-coil protein SlyX
MTRSIAAVAVALDDGRMAQSRVELESKIALLEHTVDALSGELAAQQRQIDRLEHRLEALVQQHKRMQAGEGIEPHDTPPPHWGR